MSTASDSGESDFLRRKDDANQTLSQIYKKSQPQIHLQTGFTDEDFPKAIEKVSRGLDLLLNLCQLELDRFVYDEDELSISSFDSLDFIAKPVFAEGGNLGYAVSEDALWLMKLLVDLNKFEDFDYEEFVAPLYDFFKICLKTNTGAGDMYLRITDTLLKAAQIDESYELQITKDVVKACRENDQNTQRWLSGILTELDTLLNSDSNTDSQVSVVRFYDNDYVVAYANSDFVEFDELDLDMTNKSRYNDDYVHGQVYRNDKVFPNNAEDWLTIVLPENDESIILGKRSYRSIEEAQESEQQFMNWLQALLDD